MVLAKIYKLLKENITLKQKQARHFFKCTPGEHATHDQFLGITVPHLKIMAKEHNSLQLRYITELLKSPYNECRLLALFILVIQYQKSDPAQQKNLHNF